MSLKSPIRLTSALALPLYLMLSACGGGGMDVASIPPSPPAPTQITPTPTSTPTPTPTAAPTAGSYPVTTAGTYELLGRFFDALGENLGNSSGITDSGDFAMTVSRPYGNQGFAYKLNASTDFMPGGVSSVEYGPAGSWSTDPDGSIHGDYSQTLPFSADKNLLTGLRLQEGFSYVSMGEWVWDFVHLDGGSAGGFGEFLFVTGDRTPATAIPTSGTATYDAQGLVGFVKAPFALIADFGQRSMSTRIDQDYRYNAAGDIMDYPTPGIHVGGSTPFSDDGRFDIPLTGTANFTGGYGSNTPETPPSRPVTGDMDGAFFGPQAEQVGGTFRLNRPDGTLLLQDAFVGQQRHP